MFQRHNVLFDGKTGVKAHSDDLISLQIPSEISQPWEDNFVFSEWTFSMWFNL